MVNGMIFLSPPCALLEQDNVTMEVQLDKGAQVDLKSRSKEGSCVIKGERCNHVPSADLSIQPTFASLCEERVSVDRSQFSNVSTYKNHG